MNKNLLLWLIALINFTYIWGQQAGEHALGSRKYDDYEKPEVCKSCHTRIYQQWRQAMMSQAFTHHWDEVEYFELAIPHSQKDPFFKAASATGGKFPGERKCQLRSLSYHHRD
ncbi:MAG TPA: hypothetical protein ENN20_08730 [Candidatus Marinimicrobia bacterium]|nr:hypothetical protein [Candidatus Neomarinimicrobiota bacterium]